MKRHTIIFDLISIKNDLQRISMDLNNPNIEIIIDNCISKLSSNINAINNTISSNSSTKQKTFTIDKDELINYLYYLEDKIDYVYFKEVNHSINKFVETIQNYKG